MPSKLLVVSGGVVLSGVTGLGIGKLSSSNIETFKDRLRSEFKDSKWKILDSKNSEEWSDVKEIYDLSNSLKIKKGESNLTSSELPDGCVDILSKSYSQDNGDSVKKYCLINTNSIVKELGDKAISVDSKANNLDTEGLKAGQRYEREKAQNTSLQVDDSDIKAANDETKGKTAMKKGCETSYTKLMYKNGSESAFSLASKGCVKPLP